MNSRIEALRLLICKCLVEAALSGDDVPPDVLYAVKGAAEKLHPLIVLAAQAA